MLNKNDQRILERMNVKVLNERRALKEMIETLQEIYDHKIYAKLGYSSIIKYLIGEYHYSESAAYRRFRALKLTMEMPETLLMFQTGSLSLSNAASFHSITNGASDEDKKIALAQIQFKTNDDAKKEMFAIFPEKEITETPSKKRITKDKLSLTMQITDNDFELFQDLKARLKITNNNEFLKELLTIASEKINKPVKEKVIKPSKIQRHIPLAIKRQVLQKAKYKCEYKNCNEKHFLEFDHIREIKNGGASTLDNLRILCRTHNQLRNSI